ncbi:hypothetical protein F2Q68_00032128 [Brassica cretica]|uniref:Uncharacterized protein n=1 Tax=Brassica cretica TaxID=69181 RepID=A0A8S9G277_BRACR|nr:hypothetical protein F2Q68_00032128 [Brassica cretica]
MEVGSSNSSGQLSGLVVDTRRKHRVHAELNRLQQEARFLEVRILPISSLNLKDPSIAKGVDLS